MSEPLLVFTRLYAHAIDRDGNKVTLAKTQRTATRPYRLCRKESYIENTAHSKEFGQMNRWLVFGPLEGGDVTPDELFDMAMAELKEIERRLPVAE